MKNSDRTTKATTHRPLSQAYLAIVAAVERFHYLTAAQVSRLLYPRCHDGNRYAPAAAGPPTSTCSPTSSRQTSA